MNFINLSKTQMKVVDVIARIAGRAYANRVHTTVESAVKAAFEMYQMTADKISKQSK